MSPQHTSGLQKLTPLEPDADGCELLELDVYSPGSSGSCSSCNQLVTEPWLEAGGRRWHPDCFSCSACGQQPEDRCFVTHSGQLLCVYDFNRLYNTCYRCGLLFSSPWDMAIVVPGSPSLRFHPHCFSCSICLQLLPPHQLYAAVQGEIRCARHAALPPSALHPPSVSHPPAASNRPLHNTAKPARSRRKHSRKSEVVLGEMGDGRKKRHRIQFSVQQLQDLQVAFSVNPSPDSKSIHQLASRLTLGKQHVQVWFQNRRAKERRIKSDGSPPSAETLVT
nr:Lhx1-like protein [Parasacculina yatsui]